MNIFAKINVSLFVILLTMKVHSIACESTLEQTTPASGPSPNTSSLSKTISCTNISPLPQEISSCTIVLPGTDPDGDKIFLCDHEESTHLQVIFPYEICTDTSVFIEDLTHPSGKRRITDENLEINIFRKDKNTETVTTVSQVFNCLKSLDALGGNYTMAIDLSNSHETPVAIRYKACDKDDCR